MKLLIWPDSQDTIGRSKVHYRYLGGCIREHRPDVILNLGDFLDMSSLSQYDAGKKNAECRRIRKEIDRCGEILEIVESYFPRGYSPRKIILEGNHDGGSESPGTRMYRFIQDHPVLSGELRNPLDPAEDLGWEVIPFLEILRIKGVSYSHLFAMNANGTGTNRARSYGASSPNVQISAVGGSCTAGHSPGLKYLTRNVGGKVAQGLMAGSFYTHNEDWMSPQGNAYWRGLVLKEMTGPGRYSPSFFSVEYLRKRYG